MARIAWRAVPPRGFFTIYFRRASFVLLIKLLLNRLIGIGDTIVRPPVAGNGNLPYWLTGG
jgi:hypothetical protein